MYAWMRNRQESRRNIANVHKPILRGNAQKPGNAHKPILRGYRLSMYGSRREVPRHAGYQCTGVREGVAASGLVSGAI
jgi:hypothetical protein